MTKLLTMFQVEVNNQLSYLFKDIPRNMKETSKFQLANSLAKYAVGAYIFNYVYEKLTGRRPALDGLGMLNEFFGGWIGGGRIPISSALPNISNTANALTSLASGEKDKNKTTVIAIVALLYEVARAFGYELPIAETEIQNIVNKLFYVLILMGVVVDPTTARASDSARAMEYKEPN